MRILLLNQFFWPDSSATSQLLTDVAREMARRGHEVYAIGADSGGYAVIDAGDPPQVAIHRVKALPFGRGRVGRMLSYLSFYFSAAARGVTLPRPDLVITLTTPPLISLVGTVIRLFRGSRHFIWEMDMYPDVAVDVDYFKAGSLIDRITGAMADLSRRKADGIIALGECMRNRLLGRGVSPERIHVAHNWADGVSIQPIERPGDARKLVLLYSGNLGLAHDVDTLLGAIKLLGREDRFQFLFVGSGGRRAYLEEFCRREGIDSVELRPYVQRKSLGESLGAGDIGLVTQKDACCGSVVPSKVYGLMAAGRPILFIGPREATPARIIDEFKCGWHVPCGDVASLKELLLRLADNRDEVRDAGHRARLALDDNFDLPLGVARICQIVGVAPLVQTEVLEAGDKRSFQEEFALRPEIQGTTRGSVCTPS